MLAVRRSRRPLVRDQLVKLGVDAYCALCRQPTCAC